MRKAGKLAALVLEQVCAAAKEGVTTNELDKLAHDITIANGGTNACLGYKGYPKSICTSVNEMLCHGVPNDEPLKNGDIVNIDVTVKVGPYHGDTSRTVAIGEVSTDAYALICAAREAMMAGIAAVRPNGFTGDIGNAISTFIKGNYPQFTVCRDIGGHGIGRVFHDKPFIPGFGDPRTGEKLKLWSCITVEPIVLWNVPKYGSRPIAPHKDHKECKVQEIVGTGGLAAQFEHTVLITVDGPEILTEIPILPIRQGLLERY
jgi:methionyl aminopeptidase